MSHRPEPRRCLARVLLVWLSCVFGMPVLAQGMSAADSQLLTGARHFRDERYAEALVAFKAAEKLGATGEVRWYVGSTLAKLGRPEEAVEAFVLAEQETSGHGDDALLSYYFAMACYDAQLFACAESKLLQVGARAGPRVGGQARKVLDDLRSALKNVPAESIDVLMTRGTRALERGRTHLGIAYFDEAAALARKRQDSERLRVALEKSAQARAGSGRGAPR